MLIQYIRDSENKPIGCMVADMANCICYIGFSFYHRKKETVPFTKKLAVKIAYNRMVQAGLRGGCAGLPYTKLWDTDAIPEHASDQYVKFIRRCTAYFKPAEIRVY